MTLEVVDSDGEVIRSFSSDSTRHEGEPTVPVSEGMNTFVWDFRHEGLELPEGAMVYLGYAGGPRLCRAAIGCDSRSVTGAKHDRSSCSRIHETKI